MQIENVGDDTVVLTVTVDADQQRVFDAFTRPEDVAAWFWPSRLAATYRFDVRDGGEFAVRSEAAGMGVRGTYLVVRPPHELSMTWRWDGDDDESAVLVELADAGDGRTAVTLTHGANPTVASRDDHATGWRDCLGRLAAWA